MKILRSVCMMKILRSVCMIVTSLVLTTIPALASPVMIRLGYASCSACHISPQGGGLLTDYGKGIDKAQSLFAGEYYPDPQQQNRPFRHDVRGLLVHSTSTSASGQRSPYRLWTELTYRHAFWLTTNSRFSYHASVEATPVSAAGAPSDPRLYVNHALWQYRPREGVEIAVGRDALPNGLGVPDREPLFRRASADTPGGYPTQAKLFLWTERFELTPYVFGPGNKDSAGAGEHGAGILGGMKIGARAVAGISARMRRDDHGSAESVGFYTRLGFGRWGILALQEFGEKNWETAGFGRRTAGFGRRTAGYAQLYVAPYEWLVTSLTVERLRSPLYEETRLRPEVQLRATNNLTVVVSVRDDLTDSRRDRPMRVYAIQLAVKGMQ